MLKKFVSLILTAMIITSAVSVGTVLAESVSEKTIDFENTGVEVGTYFTENNLTGLERYAVSSGDEIDFPETVDNYVLKIPAQNTSQVQSKISLADNEVTNGIIEYKMDVYYDNYDDSQNATKSGIGLAAINGNGGRKILWRINTWSSKQLTTSDTNTVDAFDDETWYTFKTVINLNEGYYELHYKNSDDVDIPQNYTKATFSKNEETKLPITLNNGGAFYVKEFSLYNHAATTLPQYVDNISIKTYDNPVNTINNAADADKIEAVLKDLSDIGLFSFGSKKYMVADYSTALMSMKNNVTSVSNIQTVYNNLMESNKADYITDALTLDNITGGRYVNSGADIYYRINNESYLDFGKGIEGIVDIKFDTIVKAAADTDVTKYDIGFSSSNSYIAAGKLLSLIKDNNISARNSAWADNKMTYDKLTSIRLILNTSDSNAETLRGYIDENPIKFPRSYSTLLKPKYENLYVYDNTATSDGKNNNGIFIDNPRYLVFQPGKSPDETLNYINNLTAVVYKPFHTAVNDADSPEKMEEVFKAYEKLGEITLSDDVNYENLYDKISEKIYDKSRDIQNDYDLLLKDGDIYAELGENELKLSFINTLDLQQSGTLIIAAYNGNELVECIIPDFTKKTYEFADSIEVDMSGFKNKDKNICVFVWQDITKIKPLTAQKTIVTRK